MKTQVTYNDSTGVICGIEVDKGSIHDFRLFKETFRAPLEGVRLLADLGYVGIDKIYPDSEIPVKKPRGKELSPEDKAYNRIVGAIRVTIEHVNAWLKRFHIVGHKYRGPRNKFWRAMYLIAFFFNMEAQHRAG